MVRVFKQCFTKDVPKVTWDDIIHKIEKDCVKKVSERDEGYVSPYVRWVAKDMRIAPTYVLFARPDSVHPPTLQKAYNEISAKTGANRMVVYISFSANSQHYGRHKDTLNVLITQAIGKMSYKFDDGTVHTIGPGDSIFIPKGVYHEPIIHGPRVTLSLTTVE